MNVRIQSYRFEDSKKSIITLAVILLVLAYVLVLDNDTEWFAWGRMHVCLLQGIALLYLYYRYGWANRAANGIILLVYVLLFVAELIGLGIPAPPNRMSVSSRSMSMGIALELFLQLTPFLYAGLRVAGTLLIAHVMYRLERLRAVR